MPVTAFSHRGLPGVEEVLGPAWLSHGVSGAARRPPERRARSATWVPGALDRARDVDLADLVAACSVDDVVESAVEGLTNVHVARDAAGVVVAAAGWELWPGAVANAGVLVAQSARGAGAATAVAGAVVEAALRQGLLVQWRARPVGSRRLAQRLGLVEVVWQLSWR